MTAQIADTRRYDIDWLRVIAFIFLILYHIAMYYVADWGWHVKSEHQSHFLQNIMLLINPWRMSLIFLISGIALALVEHKISSLKLLQMRFLRVFIPLVIAMYLIVPPQLYFELIGKEGFSGGYLSFLGFYIDAGTDMYPNHQHGSLGLLTWNHLWYLAYLWHYTLIYIVVRGLATRIDWQGLLGEKSALPFFVVLVGLLMFYAFVLKPYFPATNALIDDWYNHALYFTVFSFGYILAKAKGSWEGVIKNRRVWVVIAVSHYLLLLVLFHDVFGSWLRSSGYDSSYVESLVVTKIIVQWIVCANIIAWLFSVVGYAGAYLNKPNPILRYMNEAILPWYILHQTVIVVVAVGLSALSLGTIVEPVLLIVVTFFMCAACYEFIKRWAVTRFIFGMKPLEKGE